MWDVLKEYPTARIRLEAIATKRLEKYKNDPSPEDKLVGEFTADAVGNDIVPTAIDTIMLIMNYIVNQYLMP